MLRCGKPLFKKPFWYRQQGKFASVPARHEYSSAVVAGLTLVLVEPRRRFKDGFNLQLEPSLAQFRHQLNTDNGVAAHAEKVIVGLLFWPNTCCQMVLCCCSSSVCVPRSYRGWSSWGQARRVYPACR